MTRRMALLLLGVVLAGCGGVATEPRQRDSNPAVAIEREVERLAASRAGDEALWPGFDPLTIPLAVYDGERTYLFRHPAPPEGFTPMEEGAPDVLTREGRHEAVTANTSSEIGGVPTATLMVDATLSERSVENLAAVAIHEGFHVYQRAHHPSWIANEADLFVYPTDSPDLLALRRLETTALRRALDADDGGGACWARRALALREERFARMDEPFAAYERGTELNEGLATYVEMRAAGRREVDLPAAGFGAADVRRRAYASGPALALLLDRFRPGWPAAFETDDGQTLDGALEAALGEGDVCAFEEAAIAAARQAAIADVAELVEERQGRLAAFEAKPGWRVVIEASSDAPLWPQGFDPLNVATVGEGRVLHSRYLRLGNDAGSMEVLNAEALTRGAGSHPLFQGVRRAELTGLAEPEVREAEGTVHVTTPGLKLEFAESSVLQEGEVITVRVGT